MSYLSVNALGKIVLNGISIGIGFWLKYSKPFTSLPLIFFYYLLIHYIFTFLTLLGFKPVVGRHYLYVYTYKKYL